MTSITPLKVAPLYPRSDRDGARTDALDELPQFQGQIQFRIDQKTEVLAKDNIKMARANAFGATMGSLFAASGNASYAMQNLLSLSYAPGANAPRSALSPSDQATLDLLRSFRI